MRPGEGGPGSIAVDDGAEGQQADHDEWFQDGADRHVEKGIRGPEVACPASETRKRSQPGGQLLESDQSCRKGWSVR